MAKIDKQTATPDLTKYQKSGDFYLKSVYLTSPSRPKDNFSLLPNKATGEGGIWISINIWEDIETPYVSGNIIVDEGQNLLQHLPIIGQEKLTIEYLTPGIDSEFTKLELMVYKVSDRAFSKDNQKFQTYKLHFCSMAKYLDLQKKVHSSFSGSISSCVHKIWKKHFSKSPTPTIDVSPTTNVHRFIIPYWTPFQTIEWLVNRAVPRTNKNAPNYLFFANCSGYRFVPLSELVQQPVQVEYTNKPSRDRSATDGIRNFEAEFLNVVEGPHFSKTADKMSDIQNGLFASELYVHDIRDKTFIRKQTYSYNENFNKEDHAEKHGIISASDITNICSKPSTNRIFYPTHYKMHNRIEDNNRSDEWLLQRRSLLEQRETNKITICVWGDSRRRVGDMIMFKTPSTEPLRSEQDWWDKQISGKYMITEIRHIISKKEHKMWITLSRDSIPEGVPDTSEIKTSRSSTESRPSSFQ